MERERGLRIKIELTRQRHSNRWLIEQLREAGFDAITDQSICHILAGRYPYKKGREVLAAAENILGIKV